MSIKDFNENEREAQTTRKNTDEFFVAPKSVAALKRYLKPAVIIYCRENFRGPVEPHLQSRQVLRKQTNAVCFGRPDTLAESWLEFKIPASCYEWKDDGFIINHPHLGTIKYSYFAPEENETQDYSGQKFITQTIDLNAVTADLGGQDEQPVVSRRIWRMGYFPMTMGGKVHRPIATTIETNAPLVDIGFGYQAFQIIAPNGKSFVFETVSGGHVATTIEELIENVARSNEEELTLQLASALPVSATAEEVSNEVFWRSVQ